MAQGATGSGRPEWGLRGLAEQANPAFAIAAVIVPVAALGGSLALVSVDAANIEWLLYVHVMAGVLWTGVDVFMGAVLGPVLGRLDVERRAAFFRAFTPKMTFLMPTLATVTIAGGLLLAQRLSAFTHAHFWMALLTAATLIPVVLLIGWQFDALRDPRTLAVLAVVTVVGGAGLALTLGNAGIPAEPWLAVAIGIVILLSVIGFGVILPGEVRIYRQITSPDPDTDVVAEIGMRNARLGGLQGLLQLSIVFVMVSIRL